MDSDPKNQPIQQTQPVQQAPQGNPLHPQAPISVPVGGAEGAPASVISSEAPVAKSPEMAPSQEQSVEAQHDSSPAIHPEVKPYVQVKTDSSSAHQAAVDQAASAYVPAWQNVQSAQATIEAEKKDAKKGIVWMALEFIKGSDRKKAHPDPVSS